MRLACHPSKRFTPSRLAVFLTLACCLAGPVSPGQAQAQTPASGAQGQPTPNANAADAPRLKASLNRILEGSEFHTTAKDENWVKDAIKQAKNAWERLRNWWNHLFSRSDLQAGSSLIIYILLTVICAGLIWVVVRMFRNWTPREFEARAVARQAIEEEALAEIEHDPNVWLAQAEEWAQKADYRRAFRAVFLAILLELDRARLLSYDRARTNGDYLKQLQRAHNQPIFDLLVSLAAAFDARWYGDQATSAQDYQTIRAAHNRLPELTKSVAVPSNLPEAQDSRAHSPNSPTNQP